MKTDTISPQAHRFNATANNGEAGIAVMEYFTDPLCCWSWAMEPHLKQMAAQLGDQLHIQYRMAGLIPAWGSCYDMVNDIATPAQMGPLWMEVKHMHGLEIDETIWFHNPPASSYPACIAVKAAALQSQVAEATMFTALQHAVMTQRKDIASWKVLDGIAVNIAEQLSVFSIDRWQQDLQGAARKTFNQDLQRKKLANITRTPSFILTRAGYRGIVVTGYRPYGELVRIFEQMGLHV